MKIESFFKSTWLNLVLVIHVSFLAMSRRITLYSERKVKHYHRRSREFLHSFTVEVFFLEAVRIGTVIKTVRPSVLVAHSSKILRLILNAVPYRCVELSSISLSSTVS